MIRWAFSIVFGVAISTMAAQAGVIAEFHFVNPHPYLIVNVADRAGTPQPWRLELDNRWELADVGMSATAFKAGDRIVATGRGGRTQPQSFYVRVLDRPADAFRYEQVGTRPTIRRR